jgi:hypothetical protein
VAEVSDDPAYLHSPAQYEVIGNFSYPKVILHQPGEGNCCSGKTATRHARSAVTVAPGHKSGSGKAEVSDEPAYPQSPGQYEVIRNFSYPKVILQ